MLFRSGLKPGSYSVKVEAQSLYYEGIFTQEGSITIIDPASLESARFRMMITIGAGILIPALSAIIINQNVIKPRKARRLKELEKRTAIFEDMANVNGFILIQKDSGLLVWEYIVNRLKGDSSLVSGFLQALMIFSSQFGITEQSGNPSNLSPQDKQQIEDEMSALSVEHADETKDVLEFNYRDLNYLVVDGEKLRFVCILNTRATDGIIERSRTYIKEFETEQAGFLAKWKGDQDEFIGPAGDMLKRVFPLYLIALYALNSSSNVAEYRSDIFRKKGLVARLFEIIESLMEERGSFKLQTVLRLLDPAERLNAKVALLELIANQIIVEKIVEES